MTSHQFTVLGVTRYLCNALRNIITFVVLSNITKYAIKTGNITQATLLINVTRYLSNIVTVTNLILCNIITTIHCKFSSVMFILMV